MTYRVTATFAEDTLVCGQYGRLEVTGRVCRYCWAHFDPRQRNGSLYCTPECSARESAWDSWIRATRDAAMRGEAGPQWPAAGKTMAAIADRHQLQLVS